MEFASQDGQLLLNQKNWYILITLIVYGSLKESLRLSAIKEGVVVAANAVLGASEGVSGNQCPNCDAPQDRFALFPAN
jgi:hypothetical protein